MSIKTSSLASYDNASKINTPSEAKKALDRSQRKKLFFAERVAVLRSLTATADREQTRASLVGCEGMRACNGNRKSEAIAEQIKNFSPLGVPIEVDGWRLSNRKTQGATDAKTAKRVRNERNFVVLQM